ncbi:hypothetical protein NW768_011477 [Fusarium equiseti]|uniref:Zn(2)-C6 fungal-type domain-containing protein n=1 Tax=Fusarium equiseti TaxID=61235 RepID=A0ABQ8QXN7_FUSEQ|nr:hypothetical protein NW768_011477 [Fusarium equiseti]
MTPSSTKLRSLLPRSSDSPDHVPTPGVAPRRRVAGAKVVTACRPCRTRKIKCDGVLPECGVCRYKSRTCEYPTQEALIRNLVQKQEALEDNVESLTSLFRYLQNRPADEANNLFERIRNGLSMKTALEFIRAEGDNSTLPDRPPNAEDKWTQQAKNGDSLSENEIFSIEASEAVVQTLQQGVDCFFSSLGTMYPIYTRPEVDKIMTTFLASENCSDDSINKRIAYGELLAICALGLQYDRQRSPSGNAKICTQFFEKAQSIVDYVLEKSPLRAMRICFCLGCYSVTAKSSLAITYAGKLSLGQCRKKLLTHAFHQIEGSLSAVRLG